MPDLREVTRPSVAPEQQDQLPSPDVMLEKPVSHESYDTTDITVEGLKKACTYFVELAASNPDLANAQAEEAIASQRETAALRQEGLDDSEIKSRKWASMGERLEEKAASNPKKDEQHTAQADHVESDDAQTITPIAEPTVLHNILEQQFINDLTTREREQTQAEQLDSLEESTPEPAPVSVPAPGLPAEATRPHPAEPLEQTVSSTERTTITQTEPLQLQPASEQSTDPSQTPISNIESSPPSPMPAPLEAFDALLLEMIAADSTDSEPLIDNAYLSETILLDENEQAPNHEEPTTLMQTIRDSISEATPETKADIEPVLLEILTLAADIKAAATTLYEQTPNELILTDPETTELPLERMKDLCRIVLDKLDVAYEEEDLDQLVAALTKTKAPKPDSATIDEVLELDLREDIGTHERKFSDRTQAKPTDSADSTKPPHRWLGIAALSQCLHLPQLSLAT